MALNGVKRKLNKRLYQTAREFFQDFELIFNNAMTYNVEDSLIYKDAQLLLDQLHLKRKEITPVLDTVLVTNSPKSLTPSKLKQKRHTASTDTTTPGAGAIKPADLNAPLPKFTDLKDKLTYLYNFIRDFQHEGRDLAPPFLLLPSKLDYPDYYSVIKKPIDMTKILNKINHHKVTEVYTNVDEMCLDFAQMFENACTYNEPASTLYKDALNLQRALFLKRDQIYQNNAPTNSAAVFSRDPVNDFQAEIDFIKSNGVLTNDFIGNAVQSLLGYLFEQCMLFQDMEGRTLSESFLDLYAVFDRAQQQE
jgi:protein polybromo-1